MRPPKGAWMMSCIPPPSSKKRSAMMVDCVGTSPSTARPSSTYWINCSEPDRSSPHSSPSQATVSATTGRFRQPSTGTTFSRRSLMSFRNPPSCCDSSAVRAGASPRQNGTPGGAPCASSTSIRDDLPSILRIRHEVFPNSMISPAMLSTAKSSSTVPTIAPSGSATTVNRALSGIAPPQVIAARRAPRRGRSFWLMRS